MSQNKLENIRHTLAHLLASSVREIYPEAKNAIGPSIENGFYQDFDMGENKISDTELPEIEKLMKKKLKEWKEFEKKEVSKEEALAEFSWNEYKTELIEEFAEEGKNITFYTSGGFIDLCKGGHIENPAKDIDFTAFKLSRVAGAYWRGDEKNKMLTRIYGLAFETKEDLKNYEAKIEEARKRDHKKLGKELDLFIFSELVGPGLPLFTPKGTMLRDIVDQKVWQLRKKYGYERVDIPHVTKKDLYEKSGHWAKFSEELLKIKTREDKLLVMKPMNCPHHIQIFDRKQWSYRELPERYASTTKVYRDEQSGELSGLSRVISITQDDAHVFCRTDQVKEEAEKIWNIIIEFYSTFGFELKPRLSMHDKDQMDKYLGNEEMWLKAENELRTLAKEKGMEAVEAVGEAAFYGPKIDFIAKDSIGREWQVGTIQLDVNLPDRFDLNYINDKGTKERVVMIHAAIMGSIERFLSIVIEHYGGAFPFWLSPVQVKVVPVSEKQIEYAREITEELKKNNIRAELDGSDESLGKKIRKTKVEKIPYWIVVGDKEMESGTITYEDREGKKETLSKDEVIKYFTSLR